MSVTPIPVAAVVFDVGETLVDETEAWSRWADWLNIPKLTFFAAFGGLIARGESTHGIFSLFGKDIDPRAEIQRRRDAGEDDGEPDAKNLYPDALPAITALKTKGFLVGAAGNQFASAYEWISKLEPPLDLVGISALWKIAKPDQAFFQRICTELALPPERIAYVGDRIDNDLVPAKQAGLHPIFIRRGPWGYSQPDPAGVLETVPRIESLLEVLDIVTLDPG